MTRRLLLVGLLVTWPVDGSAQGLLANLTNVLVDSAVIDNPSHGGIHFVGPTDTFELPLRVLESAAAQIASPFVASSSGGFQFTFDARTGLFIRKSETFGPAFAERAQTLGRGHWSVGGGFQRVRFTGFEGRDFERGLPFALRHVDLPPFSIAGSPPDAFFEGDVLENTVFLDASTERFTLFANYGVTDRLDVGVALPVIRLHVDARVHSRLVRQATAAAPDIHSFDAGGSSTTIRRGGGTASGLGDVVLRAKYLALDRATVGAAVGVDVRLPTANSNDLLGPDATQTRIYGVISGGQQRLSPHVNVGYTLSSGGVTEFTDIPDEVTYALGAELAATPTLTLAADVLGRSLRGFGRYELRLASFPFRTPDGAAGAGVFEQFQERRGRTLHLTQGTIGFKWNGWPHLLLSAHILFPLTRAGLNAGISPVIALDYSIGRR